MRSAISLAKKAVGRTSPNPLVGAVIVRDNKILAEGYHHKYGDLHAERDALRNAKERGIDVSGAEMYVTLEPCCHYGKQPPCTEAIVEAGIKKVYIGSRDPNPLVHGKGAAFLKSRNIQVVEDFLRGECDSLNPVFFYYITTRMPYVALKYAMTADGKIATKTGESKWISCQASRDFSHGLRNRYTCILCGIGTVLSDNPLLTCRIEGGRNPVRIVCDSSLRIPLDSNIVKTAGDVRTIVACGDSCALRGRENFSAESFFQKEKALAGRGVEILHCGTSSVDFRLLMQELGKMNLDSVLVEGGGRVNYSMLNAGVVSRIYSFISPKIFGGAEAPSPIGGGGISSINDAFILEQKSLGQCGSDVLIEYDVQYPEVN